MFQAGSTTKTAQRQSKQLTTRQHKRIKRQARHLVDACQERRAPGRSGPKSVTPDDLIALAFGHRIQLDQDQALSYLEYARVAKGLYPDIIASPDDADDQQQIEAGAEEAPTPGLP